jgi:hypothetical protein
MGVGFGVGGLRDLRLGHASWVVAGRWANAIDDWLWVVSVGLMGTFLFQLFADGRLPSRRWRPLAYLSGAALLLTVASDLFLTGSVGESAVPASGNPFAPSALGVIPNVAAFPCRCCFRAYPPLRLCS